MLGWVFWLGIRNLWSELLRKLYVRLFIDVYGLLRMFGQLL